MARKKTPNSHSDQHKSTEQESVSDSNSPIDDIDYDASITALYIVNQRCEQLLSKSIESADKLNKELQFLVETQREIREILIDIEQLLECVEIVEI